MVLETPLFITVAKAAAIVVDAAVEGPYNADVHVMPSIVAVYVPVAPEPPELLLAIVIVAVGPNAGAPRKADDVPYETALPLKLIAKVFKATGPALFAVIVTVPKVSGLLLLCEVPPIAATETVTLLRITVCTLPAALEIVTVADLFDVFPKAVTSVEDETILKVLVLLSAAPLEANVAALPFKTSDTEFACGTTTGVAKWKE